MVGKSSSVLLIRHSPSCCAGVLSDEPMHVCMQAKYSKTVFGGLLHNMGDDGTMMP